MHLFFQFKNHCQIIYCGGNISIPQFKKKIEALFLCISLSAFCGFSHDLSLLLLGSHLDQL